MSNDKRKYRYLRSVREICSGLYWREQSGQQHGREKGAEGELAGGKVGGRRLRRGWGGGRPARGGVKRKAVTHPKGHISKGLGLVNGAPGEMLGVYLLCKL